MMKNVLSFQKMKMKNKKIVMLTAYDYPSAKYAEIANVDVLLVGDTLGMVVLGYENTLQVTLDDIIYHTKAVRRGAKNTFIIADMPFGSYHISDEETRKNAIRLITETGANAVKLEGGSENRLATIKTIRSISDCEIPVVAHLGLTPQSINSIGGYKVQGKKDAQYQQILQQAIDVEKAGAFMLVLEAIPEKLGKEISENISIPTVGIGAGKYTDGQVLVYHDILGMSDFQPKFVKKYANLEELISNKIGEYCDDVKSEKFPQKENIYYPIED